MDLVKLREIKYRASIASININAMKYRKNVLALSMPARLIL